ncbi:MAG: TrkA C-terminal domain-containing protein, partial [Bacilli bacterium]|nr:TrkA C-terminal domain-containing protein [Bacilli bacterium]
MNIWLAVSLILGVISIYLFMIEVFSVAFKLTGLATSKIRFQVASLFTGTGFTTTESELITNDERRRKIAVVCTYTGHVFSVVIMGLVINVLISISNSIGAETDGFSFFEWYFIVFYISIGLFLLVLFIKIPPINKRFQRFLEKIAIKISANSKKTNIITVLDMYGKHAIVELILNRIPESLNEVPLYKMGLTKRYIINILSLRRGNRVIDITKDTMFVKGDIIVIYGLIKDIKEVFINSLNNEKDTIV